MALQSPDNKPTQTFKQALELHKAIDKKIGLEGLSDFHKALEAGDKPKARRIVNALPSSHPLKKDMLVMLDLV